MNNLSSSTSPYLLQHAHNPVDWHIWNRDSLTKAQTENKPIFLSIGYAACHWCHVMAHESFEDETTAAFMNEHFVNIKVDREERPDLDAIYMQATVAMTGSGGWPMSVFLTPDLKPFYAGTYFPPAPRYNMPSFRDVLTGIARTWQEQQNEIQRVSNDVIAHLRQSLNAEIQRDTIFTPEHLNVATTTLLDAYDWGNGGWGDAPKFPQPMSVDYLLIRSLRSDKLSGESDELNAAIHALRSMARGGMYDVIGGGFSRYSVDTFWRVPHFEKMLYDNAQLARTYLHAWQLTKDPFLKRIVTETLDFIAREMTHPGGGFYSSLDADSEGEEGRFYVWTRDEIRSLLEEEADFFETAYGISPQGNWEGHTVLQRALDDASLAARFKIDREAVAPKLAKSHSKLLQARSARIRPATDDKILTSWNGLMLAAFAEAARTLHDDEIEKSETQSLGATQSAYYKIAVRNAEFLLTEHRPQGKLKHSWRNAKTTNEVFLEDYGSLILGLLELYQTDFDNRWFVAARELANEMIDLFSDPEGGFFDTAKDGETLLLRPKDLQDNATPSGNALACEALLKLSAFTDDGRLRDLAEASLRQVVGMAVRYPTAFGRWLSAAEFALNSTKQIAVMYGADERSASELVTHIRSSFRPNTIIAASIHPPRDESPPLLRDRPLKNGAATVYVCEGFVCKNPVTSASELEKLL